MNTNQKHQFGQLSENKANQPSSRKQGENQKEEPVIPVPDEPTTPEPPEENPEPGLNEPEKDDPTRIDEEPPIFNNY